MAKAVSAFSDFPWFQDFGNLSRISRQLEMLHASPADSYIRSIMTLADSPILQDVNHLAALYDTPLRQTIQEIGGLASKLNIPEIPARRWDIPALTSDFSQNDLNYLTLWTNSLFNHWDECPASDQGPFPNTEEKLTHLTALAEEVANSKSFQETPAFSESDRQTAIEEATAILTSGGNWEQRFMESIQAFSKTHPVVAWILEKVLFAILIGIITNLLSSGLGEMLHPARLYEAPSSSSQVIYQIQSNQSVIVIGDVPYYYAARIQDSQTGEIFSGYVSKRSVRLCEGDPSRDTGAELPEEPASPMIISKF